MWLRFDNSEIPAAMHHAHQVEHAVVIALLPAWHGRVPELFDKSLCKLAIVRGQAGHRRRRQQANGVARRERLAVEGITIGEAVDALPEKKLLDTVAKRRFTPVFV